ncbi:NADPH:quinone reductase-like protein [Rhodococcus ruber BKS 20-38]|uniref:NADPH:quinone reductase-like protein n=1 Tax=Rhodococcus ruber BKS 20-38 TaxID=1278076 RepID=M2YQF6_9NOCA|nr:NAD(P)H-binding protein [Rhodococcus ruber]EME64200.1 NADPH:quinone reductase-like protein [Rhodococcus ruber BKS 20-38]
MLVTGANGNVGSNLAPSLVQSGCDVRVLVRDSARHPSVDGAQVVEGDLAEPSSLRPGIEGVDSVFLLLTLLPGVEDFESIVTEIAAAGVRHIVLLSSVTVLGDAQNVLGELNREAERSVANSGIDYTFLRAGAFHSNAMAWASSIRNDGVVHDSYAKFVSAPVDPRDIAAVAREALLSAEHRGKIHTLTGPEKLSYLDQAAILGEVLRREITFCELGTEKARSAMIHSGRRPERVDSLLRMQRNNDVYLHEVRPTVSNILGRPATSFRQWAQDFAGAFR